jgi:hypothetical protein
VTCAREARGRQRNWQRRHVLAVCLEALVAGGPKRLLYRVTPQFFALSTRLIAVPASPVDPAAGAAGWAARCVRTEARPVGFQNSATVLTWAATRPARIH